jgi:hypothetical protein
LSIMRRDSCKCAIFLVSWLTLCLFPATQKRTIRQVPWLESFTPS